MDRRDFLRYASAAGVSVAIPGVGRHALSDEPIADGVVPPYTGPLYVILEAPGGWDVTMSIDPKGGEYNRTYQQGDILTSGALSYAPGVQAQTDFLSRHHGDLIAFNGINVATNSHPAGLRYTWTGRSDNANYPTFAALVAAVKSPNAALSHLALGGYTANGGVVPLSRISHPSKFDVISSPDNINGQTGRYVTEDTRALLDQAHARSRPRRDAHFHAPRANLKRDAMYLSQLSVGDLKRIKEAIPDDVGGLRIRSNAAIAFAAYKAGACVSVNLKVGQFDSHDGNDAKQLTNLELLFQSAQAVLDMAEDFDVRDDVVLIISSDFSRTPHYNGNSGKDHWSVGSMLVMGPGLAGDRVIGATDERQLTRTIDPVTGALSDEADAIQLRPEHIHLALRRYAGIHEHEYCTSRFHLRADFIDLFQTGA